RSLLRPDPFVNQSDPTTPLPLKSRLAERVCDVLRTEIEKGRWEVNLPSERRLSEEFQVGRPTLHLALCALQKEGILQKRGAQPWKLKKRPSGPLFVAKRRPEIILLRNMRIQPTPSSLSPLTDLLQRKLHRLGYGLSVLDPYAHGTAKLERTLLRIEAEH